MRRVPACSLSPRIVALLLCLCLSAAWADAAATPDEIIAQTIAGGGATPAFVALAKQDPEAAKAALARYLPTAPAAALMFDPCRVLWEGINPHLGREAALLFVARVYEVMDDNTGRGLVAGHAMHLHPRWAWAYDLSRHNPDPAKQSFLRGLRQHDCAPTTLEEIAAVPAATEYEFVLRAEGYLTLGLARQKDNDAPAVAECARRALADGRQALQLNPYPEQALYVMAGAKLYLTRDYAAGLAHINDCLRVHQKYTLGYWVRSCLYHELGRQAESDADRATYHRLAEEPAAPPTPGVTFSGGPVTDAWIRGRITEGVTSIVASDRESAHRQLAALPPESVLRVCRDLLEHFDDLPLWVTVGAISSVLTRDVGLERGLPVLREALLKTSSARMAEYGWTRVDAPWGWDLYAAVASDAQSPAMRARALETLERLAYSSPAFGDYTPASAVGYLYRAKAYLNEAAKMHTSDLKYQRHARADLDQALALDPALVVAYVERAQLFYDARQYAEAIADASRAIAREPKNLRALDLRRTAYIHLGRLEEAAADQTTLNRLRAEEKLNPPPPTS